MTCRNLGLSDKLKLQRLILRHLLLPTHLVLVLLPYLFFRVKDGLYSKIFRGYSGDIADILRVLIEGSATLIQVKSILFFLQSRLKK